jgi:thymidylate synthase (FAD)
MQTSEVNLQNLVPGTEIGILDNGFVILDDWMADDLSVVNSARVSFNRMSSTIEEKDDGLIRFLMREKHGTPFEANAFRFIIKVPIFVMREWIRHRIGSFNEWSGRYSQLDPEFYIPDYVRAPVEGSKPGQYFFESIDDGIAEVFRRDLEINSSQAYQAYEAALAKGIAKEQARLFLPVNIYTKFFWTVNARSLMNFLSLRNSPQAMWEIREAAKAVELFFAAAMPITYDAFCSNDRRAP